MDMGKSANRYRYMVGGNVDVPGNFTTLTI
jgi:hypothetical protein